MAQLDFNFYGFNWVDGPTANRLQWRQAVQDWNPRSLSVNSLDSARFWRDALPDAVIGLRNMSGPGADNSITLRLNPGEWWLKWAPLMPELRRLNVHAILGNEPNGYGSDFVTVIDREIVIGLMLEQSGVKGMYNRFSVGNPTHERSYLEQLIPLFDLIRRTDGYWMVNEYAWFDRPLLEQRDYIGRFQQAWDVAGEVPTIIGEISVNTHHPQHPDQQDSASGFRVSGLTGATFFDALATMADGIYVPAGVHSGHIFIAGGADNQRGQDILGETELFNAMERYRPFGGVDIPIPPHQEEPPMLPETPEFEPNVTLLSNGNYTVRIRMSPNLGATIIGAVTQGGVRAYDPGQMSGDFGLFEFEDMTGYVHMDYIHILRDNPTVNPNISQELRIALVELGADLGNVRVSMSEVFRLWPLNPPTLPE